MSERKTVEGGTEVSHEVTCKMEHYIPNQGHGRAHLRMGGIGGDWIDRMSGVEGTIYMPIGGANTIVTVQRIGGDGNQHVFTFDAQSMIRVARQAFEAEMTATEEPRP